MNFDRIARPGRVVELGADGYYLVEVGGGIVPAYLSDQATAAAVELDSVVTLLPMTGGFEIVSVRTGPSAGGGIILGPELIANGGFESGVLGEWPTGWEAFWAFGVGAPLVASDDTPLLGERVALSALSPTDDVSAALISRGVPSRIDDGSVYRMTAYCSARIEVGTTGVTASTRLLTAATEEGCNYFQPDFTEQVVATVSTPGEAWPLLSGDVTVPTGHTWFRPILRVAGDAGADLTIRWDSVSLRQRLA